MKEDPVILDERVVAVADRSSRLAYIILSFGVMIDVVVRGLAFGQAGWDLLGLVLISSGVATVYQRAKHIRVFSRRRILLMMLICAVVGAATAVAMAFLKHCLKH